MLHLLPQLSTTTTQGRENTPSNWHEAEGGRNGMESKGNKEIRNDGSRQHAAWQIALKFNLALDRWHKGSNAPSVTTPDVDEEWKEEAKHCTYCLDTDGCVTETTSSP